MIATAADFGATVILVEYLGLWYVLGVALGALCGAVTNFLLGRHWSFEAAHHSAGAQAVRYALVSIASLLLNVVGVWWVTEKLGLHYLGSKVGVAIVVGVFFNFPLHRKFVFR